MGPYQCSHCGRTFAQQHQLVTHFRIHSGEKPYNCGKCGQNFRHLSSHRNHRCTSPQPRHHILLETRISPDREQEIDLREQDPAVTSHYRLSQPVTAILNHLPVTALTPVAAILKYCYLVDHLECSYYMYTNTNKCSVIV